MCDGDWESLENAWGAAFRHPPRTACLPQLIANSDKAVAEAISKLSQDYESLVGCSAYQKSSQNRPGEGAIQKLSGCPLTSSSALIAAEEHLTPSEIAPDINHSTDLTFASAPETIVDVEDAGVSSVDWLQLYESLCLIQAPMVRCSRPAFRQVCRLWGTRISYTHMLIAESFVKSPHARHAEFACYDGEDRLIVQLAAKSGPSAAQAAVLVRPYCDAVDLNCGCPQRWAMKEGIGAALLEKPELVADMVRCIRNATPEGNGDTPALPCVVKMRVKDDLRHSVDFARQCEAAGAAWVTVHGRTPACHPSANVQFEAVRHVRESLSIPVVLNGGVSDVSSAMEAALRTGCGGLMSANGLLDNPAMFYCGGSASSMASEATFGTGKEAWREEGKADWSTAQGTADADAMLSSPFTPIRPVSFLWAPRRTAQGGCPPSSTTALRYTMPNMWEAVVTPRETISDFVRCAIRTDLAVPTTVQQVLRMARMYVSPAERNHLALLRSNLSVLRCLQEIGVYVEEGHITCE